MQAVIDRRRDDRDERLVDAAERLIETAQKFGGKTRGKWRARLVDQRAYGFEAEPAQRCAGFARQPQGLDGQSASAAASCARGQDEQARADESATAAQAAPGVSATASRAGSPKLSSRPARSAISLSSPPNRCAAPSMSRKKPSAPLLFESCTGRGGRRVARRPQRQAAQRGIVGSGIDGAHLQKTRFRPRVGQWLADRKARVLRRLVQGGDARAAGAGNGKDERPVRIDRACRKESIACAARKRMDRPARQPD